VGERVTVGTSLLLLSLLCASPVAHADPGSSLVLMSQRAKVDVERDQHGRIKRSTKARNDFKRQHPWEDRR